MAGNLQQGRVPYSLGRTRGEGGIPTAIFAFVTQTKTPQIELNTNKKKSCTVTRHKFARIRWRSHSKCHSERGILRKGEMEGIKDDKGGEDSQQRSCR